ncbi:hypothetical protein [Rhodocyclus tenuis]|uniref:Uncharacterized protein n=1 Tax=Rhodocyclus tenuis TaxID=1066 RepID=A0A840GAY2_RHOTE|nr:hypothetical protein [Rhodocyclus tenuis]MBB4249025.1 hypothetical protein [Rhodocyclus tenuis]
MLEIAVVALVSVLIAGVLLHRRGQVGKGRGNEEARRAPEVGGDAQGRSVCRWGVDANGEFFQVRVSMPEDARRSVDVSDIPEFLRKR